jgi:hypothetical protein
VAGPGGYLPHMMECTASAPKGMACEGFVPVSICGGQAASEPNAHSVPHKAIAAAQDRTARVHQNSYGLLTKCSLPNDVWPGDHMQEPSGEKHCYFHTCQGTNPGADRTQVRRKWLTGSVELTRAGSLGTKLVGALTWSCMQAKMRGLRV